MTITALDPNTALIIVDLQKGIVALPLVHPIEPVVERSRALLDAFRQRGHPRSARHPERLSMPRTHWMRRRVHGARPSEPV